MTTLPFDDRQDAGVQLAERLAEKGYEDPVVLALPRGGVAVGVEIARRLAAPLEVVLVRKIGVPFQPELAAGAIVDGAEREVVLNEEVVSITGMTRADIDAAVQQGLKEIERRRALYLKGRRPPDLAGRTLIVVDDGLATGASARAALKALRRKQPRLLVLAVPVAPVDTLRSLAADADEIVCLATPEPFHAIGPYYRDFHQLTDEEVVAALNAPQEEE